MELCGSSKCQIYNKKSSQTLADHKLEIFYMVLALFAYVDVFIFVCFFLVIAGHVRASITRLRPLKSLPCENPGNPRKKPDVGFEGSGANSYCKFF